MINFTKLQGNGNDFILVDEYKGEVLSENKKFDFAEKYCNRRFGIGADGILFLSKSRKAELKMRLLQPDRSEAEMCGNGIRCLVKYALDAGYITPGRVSVETLAGVLGVVVRIERRAVWVRVNMGRPVFEREGIPALGSGEFLEEELQGYKVSAVNIGVPHAVILTDNLDLPLIEAAPKIRYDPVFPKGANVNFVRVDSWEEITLRTYERGVEGETLSCGTGSVAGAAIASRLGKVGEKVRVNTKGGLLRIFLEGGFAYLEGTAEKVFEGSVDL